MSMSSALKLMNDSAMALRAAGERRCAALGSAADARGAMRAALRPVAIAGLRPSSDEDKKEDIEEGSTCIGGGGAGACFGAAFAVSTRCCGAAAAFGCSAGRAGSECSDPSDEKLSCSDRLEDALRVERLPRTCDAEESRLPALGGTAACTAC